MIGRIVLCLLTTVLLPTLSLVEAQQPAGKIPRIGYVSSSGAANDPGPGVEAFGRGLRDLGYIEGKTILVDYR
jgi:putative tryptophan/tyrosine transport system substrate-binding protein